MTSSGCLRTVGTKVYFLGGGQSAGGRARLRPGRTARDLARTLREQDDLPGVLERMTTWYTASSTPTSRPERDARQPHGTSEASNASAHALSEQALHERRAAVLRRQRELRPPIARIGLLPTPLTIHCRMLPERAAISMFDASPRDARSRRREDVTQCRIFVGTGREVVDCAMNSLAMSMTSVCGQRTRLSPV